MKRSLLLSFIIALCMPLLGNPVDENTAKQLAQNFWKENNIMGVRGDKVFKKRMDDARFVNIAPQCGYSEFYIFNNEDGEGFVIIAADDFVTPILGYSYDNNFAAENLPPNLKGWLDGYAEQIQTAVEMRAETTEEIRTDWECLRQRKNLPIKTETAVGPLITTYWDQGYPYNYYCPYNSLTGETTYTGCVATAMAQIMKYWNYPTHGYGSHSYSDWFYGNISANFDNTTYQWSSMPSSLNANSSQTQINAVATLMFHCGISVEMNYGIDGSSASVVYNDYDGYHTYCAENALKNYFGYNSVIGRKRTGYYSDSEWINLLKWDLDDSIAILYKGQGSGGHAFVCDGYNYNNYFHFNWGWSGAADAYYYINNLNPNSNNFSEYQSAVFGICPPINYISATSSPSEGGSVTGSGYYYTNRSCTVHATANAGYSFVNWTENGTQVSTNPSYTFIVDHDRTLKANFQRKNYIITTTANPTNGGSGTPIGGNSYQYGQTCTVRAVANTDFLFVNWTENGAQVSTEANYTFTVTRDRNLVANFQGQQYAISVSANPSNGGSVSIPGELSYNFDDGFSDWTTIDADGDGINWKRGTEVLGTGHGHNGSYDLLLSQSYSHENGVLFPDNYLVSPQISLGGSISFWACAQDNDYHSEHFGVAVSTTSNANANSFSTIQEWTMSAKCERQFSNHSRDGISRVQGNWYQFTVDLSAFSGQIGYIAIRHFNCSDMFYLDVDDVSIHIAGGNTYYQGQSCTVHASANSGYTFVNWTENGVQVSTNANYSFTVTSNRNLVANFALMGGLDENIDAIEIYPNPTSGIVNFDCHDMVEVKVFNALGVMVKRQTVEGEDNAQIDLSTFSDGLYILQAISPTQTTTIRVVKAE